LGRDIRFGKAMRLDNTEGGPESDLYRGLTKEENLISRVSIPPKTRRRVTLETGGTWGEKYGDDLHSYLQTDGSTQKRSKTPEKNWH